jgi:hypothetical protein
MIFRPWKGVVVVPTVLLTDLFCSCNCCWSGRQWCCCWWGTCAYCWPAGGPCCRCCCPLNVRFGRGVAAGWVDDGEARGRTSTR